MAQVTKYDDQLESKLKEAELLQEQIGLLQRVREIELEITGGVVAATVATVPTVKATAPVQAQAAPTGEVKRRGRPKGTTNAVKAAGVATDDGKSVDLPTLLETIAQQVNRPLLLADFVTLAREAGYTTKAKDFSNMVYQSVLKLVKKGLFKKNEETRAYEYVGKAA
jgi:hypothetical protein